MIGADQLVVAKQALGSDAFKQVVRTFGELGVKPRRVGPKKLTCGDNQTLVGYCACGGDSTPLGFSLNGQIYKVNSNGVIFYFEKVGRSWIRANLDKKDASTVVAGCNLLKKAGVV